MKTYKDHITYDHYFTRGVITGLLYLNIKFYFKGVHVYLCSLRKRRDYWEFSRGYSVEGKFDYIDGFVSKEELDNWSTHISETIIVTDEQLQEIPNI